MEKTKIQGALLRIERLHQNKGQKEICFGICVPSYLSKIEHGTVTPDEEIIHKLFQKMNISFYTEEEIIGSTLAACGKAKRGKQTGL